MSLDNSIAIQTDSLVIAFIMYESAQQLGTSS
jgi:hypothetical protein